MGVRAVCLENGFPSASVSELVSLDAAPAELRSESPSLSSTHAKCLPCHGKSYFQPRSFPRPPTPLLDCSSISFYFIFISFSTNYGLTAKMSLARDFAVHGLMERLHRHLIKPTPRQVHERRAGRAPDACLDLVLLPAKYYPRTWGRPPGLDSALDLQGRPNQSAITTREQDPSSRSAQIQISIRPWLHNYCPMTYVSACSKINRSRPTFS